MPGAGTMIPEWQRNTPGTATQGLYLEQNLVSSVS